MTYPTYNPATTSSQPSHIELVTANELHRMTFINQLHAGCEMPDCQRKFFAKCGDRGPDGGKCGDRGEDGKALEYTDPTSDRGCGKMVCDQHLKLVHLYSRRKRYTYNPDIL